MSNNELKNLTLISNDFSFNPHATIIMSEIICSLTSTNSLNVEKLKFTLDQSCKIKYKNLMLLKYLKKLYIYYNVQNETSNLDRLIGVILSIGKIQVTFREYMIPFPSHSGNVDYLMSNFKYRSEICANKINLLGKNVEVYPLKYKNI